MRSPSHLLSLAALTWAFVVPGQTASNPEQPAAPLDRLLAHLPHVEYGDDRAPLDALDRYVAAAGADQALRARLEESFIAVLAGDATLAAKDYACRSLRLVGSPKCVPALAALLSHPQLSSLARYGLEPLPYPEVDAALREALPRLPARLQIGVLTSLGARRDPMAVPVIRPLTAADDLRLAEAAMVALAKIGTPEAVTALADLHEQTTGRRRLLAAQSLIEGAWRLIERGQAGRAVPWLEALYAKHLRPDLREAAFEALVAAEPRKAAGRLLAALRSGEERLTRLAGQLVARRPGTRTPPRLLRALPDLPPVGRAALLDAIAARRDRTAREAVLARLDDAEPAVRSAAVRALGSVGNAEDVSRLARLAAAADDLAPVARRSLLDLAAPGVPPALAALARTPDTPPAVRVVCLQVLAERNLTGQAGAAVRCLKDADPGVRLAAARTLAVIGQQKQLPALLQRLPRANDDAEAQALLAALGQVARRVGPPAMATLAPALTDSPADLRARLLGVLPGVGGHDALAAVREALKDDSPAVRGAAVRALSAWPDSSAAADLLQLVRQPRDEAERTLAFRGYVRMIREAGLDPRARLEHLQTAMELARTIEERRLVVGATSDIVSTDALEWTARYLDDPALANEAGAAVVRIAQALGPEHSARTLPLIEKVLERVTAKPVRDSARLLQRRWRQLDGR
ncbi:MAG: hypothetical protein D6766_02820 [Verrucomicrobia bacterium]|nr:MAG: hypothetical protein D6766_02820 [Verrucomicrobiota bacterium]